MPKMLPQVVKDNIEKTRYTAIAAVDSYNRSGPRFRTAQFIILVVISWTALFHAIFYSRNKKPWYRLKAKGASGIRYEKVDGDPKHWDLHKCLAEYFGNADPPERKNLEFLIGLRNKIEHRNLPHLDPALFGECQASLLNLESLLVSEFGNKYALADELGIAMQFSQLVPDEKTKAVKSAMKTAGVAVLDYVATYRGSLPPAVLESMKYSFSVFLVPRVANRERATDAAIQFVKVDEASPDELSRLQKLNVLIRDKHIPIANLNLLRPGDVVDRVAASIPHRFDLHLHTCAWRHFTVRPPSKASKPEKTDARFCIFDAAHGDYLYTESWISHLIEQLTPATRFQQITGRAPMPKAKGV